MISIESFAKSLTSNEGLTLTELNKQLFLQLQKIMNENESLKKENRMLQKHVRIDPLTQVYNRSFMNQAIEDEMARCSRYGKKFSIVILDLDYFKDINDTYGHPAGDVVLKKAAQIFKNHVRQSDSVFRYGGEEFLIILSETDIEGAAVVADKIRNLISKADFKGVGRQVTLSAGVAECNGYSTRETLLDKVDKALYEAKKTGRNRVIKAA